MKLLNHTLKYLSITLLAVIGIWAALFYYNLIDEVQDNLDDGLKNTKALVIKKVENDLGTVARAGFEEHNYSIREITEQQGITFKDQYKDTLMNTMDEQDMEPYRLLTSAFYHQQKFYEVKVISSTVEKDDLLENLWYSIIWLYVAILISIIIINNVLLRRIWAPFYQLLERLKAFKLDKDQTISVTKTNVTEFKELNQAVSSLVDQSVKIYGSQKQFIENAAHELQTPLAISLNRLELLAETEGLADAQLEAIGQVMQTLERLTRLNKSLLLISKIETRQYGVSEDIAINVLVKNLINEFEDFASIREVDIHLEEQAELYVSMNKDLAAILFSNLLKNAILHNFKGGQVKITISLKTLTIANTGSSNPLDENKIFKRFEKGSSEKDGTGLGLAIAKAITTLYDYQLQYFYSDLQHKMSVNF